jgi:hypothetical protein
MSLNNRAVVLKTNLFSVKRPSTRNGKKSATLCEQKKEKKHPPPPQKKEIKRSWFYLPKG